MTEAIVIRAGQPEEAQHLLEASHALMNSLFPAQSNHFLSLEELRADTIRFFIVELHGKIAGCAALADKGPYGELKSMFVDPAKRGAKLGRRLLEHIEAQARETGHTTLRLETGDSLIAAQKLYQAHGFAYRGPFGAYTDDPRSRFMEKPLD